jgi:hypothetical protein
MPTWPATLPQKVLVNGYTEKPPGKVLRSTVDQGPAKVRRLSTDQPRVFNATVRLTNDQIAIWEDFYYNTVLEVLPFDFPHPRGGSTISVRVVNNTDGAPPVTPQDGNDRYNLALVLEQMP